MNARKTPENTQLLRLAILVSIVSSAFSAFLLLKLNGIVHSELYNYGLQFSLNWASPYWDTERLVYTCLAVPSILGGLVLAYGFMKRNKVTAPIVRAPVTKQVETTSNVSHAQAPKENSMLISCPNCKKVFGRPLNMLDFSKETTQLVNVCPYCNHVLGSTAKTDPDNIRVIGPDEKEIEDEEE
jgi:hypothetical protein